MQEIEEEERRVENTKHALVVSNVKRREERQSSPSFDWMHEQSNEAYTNEQAESPRQHGNNGDIIEMLARMEEKIKERDN